MSPSSGRPNLGARWAFRGNGGVLVRVKSRNESDLARGTGNHKGCLSDGWNFGMNVVEVGSGLAGAKRDG